jgi:hypothetical protein
MYERPLFGIDLELTWLPADLLRVLVRADAKGYSGDLQERVMRRAMKPAERFEVSVASAVKCLQR